MYAARGRRVLSGKQCQLPHFWWPVGSWEPPPSSSFCPGQCTLLHRAGVQHVCDMLHRWEDCLCLLAALLLCTRTRMEGCGGAMTCFPSHSRFLNVSQCCVAGTGCIQCVVRGGNDDPGRVMCVWCVAAGPPVPGGTPQSPRRRRTRMAAGPWTTTQERCHLPQRQPRCARTHEHAAFTAVAAFSNTGSC